MRSKSLAYSSRCPATPHQKLDAPQSDYGRLRSGFGTGQVSLTSSFGQPGHDDGGRDPVWNNQKYGLRTIIGGLPGENYRENQIGQKWQVGQPAFPVIGQVTAAHRYEPSVFFGFFSHGLMLALKIRPRNGLPAPG
jgi:hypothetical protein